MKGSGNVYKHLLRGLGRRWNHEKVLEEEYFIFCLKAWFRKGLFLGAVAVGPSLLCGGDDSIFPRKRRKAPRLSRSAGGVWRRWLPPCQHTAADPRTALVHLFSVTEHFRFGVVTLSLPSRCHLSNHRLDKWLPRGFLAWRL